MRGVACGVLENPPLESLRDVEPIHIMLEIMGHHGMTQKFIFFTLIMLSLL